MQEAEEVIGLALGEIRSGRSEFSEVGRCLCESAVCREKEEEEEKKAAAVGGGRRRRLKKGPGRRSSSKHPWGCGLWKFYAILSLLLPDPSRAVV